VIIREIVWLENIIDKIERKHGVTMLEVRNVLCPSSHYRFIEKGCEPGEDVYGAFGRSTAGRYLVVFFILKTDGAALVISARNMSRKERRYYEKT